MRRLSVATCCVLLILATGRPAWGLPTIEQLLKTLDGAADKLKSYSYESKSQSRCFPHGSRHIGTCVGVIAREGDGHLHKFHELAEGVEGENCGPDCRNERALKHVCDGKVSWLEITQSRPRHTTVRKSPVTEDRRRKSYDLMNPILRTHAWHREYAFRVTGEKVIKGEAVWVLTSTAQSRRSQGYPAVCTLYVGKKDCFIRRKHVIVGGGVGYTFETIYSNIRTNIDVDPKLFEYTPPKGARVEDKTEPTQ